MGRNPRGGSAVTGDDYMTGQEVLVPIDETDSLRQQLLQAQRLSSVGELASSIAHEFNNILTTIINSAKLGMRNPDVEEKQKAFERVTKAGQRAAAIAVGMLGFARKSASQRVKCDVVAGDARRQLVKAADGSFDVIMLDGFCSDAIPVHLLTREAIRLYVQKLAPGGVILLHVSNVHLDLPPLIRRLAGS